jgi:hypothetical protein
MSAHRVAVRARFVVGIEITSRWTVCVLPNIAAAGPPVQQSRGHGVARHCDHVKFV